MVLVLACLQVLRSVLAAHPFNLDKVVSKGIGLKLTKSTIQVRILGCLHQYIILRCLAQQRVFCTVALSP